ncbi:hypothetical protein [Brevundimonas sp. TWP2-3-4b2]|uniref:hypothetical protein n=1 Tax=Brevundimonas sp. TWP2-3-4b2 TaxID=2804595 RepID=UPI003CF5B50B
MKSIVCVNVQIPTIQNEIEYGSNDSLRDHDIVVFDPALPWYERIEFSAGGSCMSIESTARFAKTSTHWSHELSGALAAGKTIFVVLSDYKEDQAATGSTMSSKTSRNYNTTKINNYSLIPGGLKVRNARGRTIVVKDSAYKNLYDTIKEISEYRVVFEAPTSMHTVFVAKDGTAVGGVAKFKEHPGSLVLLPHFDFQADEFTETSDAGEEIWNDKALKVSSALVGQLVAIDRMLKSSAELTPPPGWVSDFAKPKSVDEIESAIAEIDSRIEELRGQRNREALRRAGLLEYSHLLYETGKPLEHAIEKVLRLLGYKVETLRIGDLEIDHVIVGPTGRRMIGESEGKDTSAIDISKFRQLESNIGEDFEREDVDQPAKGLLFSNGFRLSSPEARAEQFTQKSLTNARRLGSALIRTADLYAVAVHLLDHPEDDAFRIACRTSIEETHGGVVVFPNGRNELQASR